MNPFVYYKNPTTTKEAQSNINYFWFEGMLDNKEIEDSGHCPADYRTYIKAMSEDCKRINAIFRTRSLDMLNLPETAILYANDARGVYIPQYFAESIVRECLSGVSEEDMKILLVGPDHEQYWDAWCDVCDNAILTDEQGVTFNLYQDGDLWLVPTDWQPDEEDY